MLEEGTELVFATPPGSMCGSNLLSDDAEPRDYHVNTGALCLLDGHPANVSFLLFEEWLLSMLVRIETHSTHPSGHVRLHVKILREEIEHDIDETRLRRVTEWRRQRACSKGKGHANGSLPLKCAIVVVTGEDVLFSGQISR